MRFAIAALRTVAWGLFIVAMLLLIGLTAIDPSFVRAQGEPDPTLTCDAFGRTPNLNLPKLGPRMARPDLCMNEALALIDVAIPTCAP